MGWRMIRGQRYYQRSLRVAGQPRALYFGGGGAAERAAAEDERVRQARHEARQRLADARGQLEPITLRLTETAGWTDLLMRADLILSGLYQHRREWRKRGSSQKNPT